MTSSQDKFHIRKAALKDAETIIQFNINMALETEDKQLIPDVISKGVKAVLHNPQLGFYVVAERNDQVAGSLMVTFEWSDWRNGYFWWIQSVYVSQDFRRQGVYKMMYEFVRTLAMENTDVCGFRLYVEKENRVAQKTYEALGMEKTRYFLYEAPAK